MKQIKLEKVYNFRDLGGIKTSDGKKIKKALFFRSAMLNDATSADIEHLKNLNLKIIFDYRDTDELDIVKTDPYSMLGVKHYNYPTDMQNKQLYKLKKAPAFIKAFHKVTIEDIKCTYINIPFNNIGYKKMVEALQQGDVPFLQHCTAGKDRAGMGVAILLTILGAPYEEVLHDYMKSLEIKEHIEAKVGRFIPSFMRAKMLKRYEPLFVVHECLLETAFNEMLSRYKTIENYLFEEYGLDESELLRLRNKYTE